MGATNVQMACVPYPEDNQQLDLKWKKINWGAGINIKSKQWSSQTVSLSRLWNYSETQEGILTALSKIIPQKRRYFNRKILLRKGILTALQQLYSHLQRLLSRWTSTMVSITCCLCHSIEKVWQSFNNNDTSLISLLNTFGQMYHGSMRNHNDCSLNN